MRRRDFIASMGVVSVLPRAAWSRQSTCEGASDLAFSVNIPLGYDDARFSGNAVLNALKLSPNGAVSNKSITETGSNASIGTGDGATIKTVGSIRESAFVAFIGSGVNFGLRVHPDTGGDNIIRLKNVFFILHCVTRHMFSGMLAAQEYHRVLGERAHGNDREWQLASGPALSNLLR